MASTKTSAAAKRPASSAPKQPVAKTVNASASAHHTHDLTTSQPIVDPGHSHQSPTSHFGASNETPKQELSSVKPAPKPERPSIDLSGHLHPPAGLRATSVGSTGHRHDEPTDCGACAPTLQAEGWATPAQHELRRRTAIDEELKKRERARILGLDLPL